MSTKLAKDLYTFFRRKLKQTPCGELEPEVLEEGYWEALNLKERSASTSDMQELLLTACSVISGSHSPTFVGMSENSSVEALQDERRRLKEQLEEKEAILRKLSLAKSYKEKNDLAELDLLTEKWRSACQEAICQLYDILPEPKPTITEMIDSWKISHEMIRYDKEEESFH